MNDGVTFTGIFNKASTTVDGGWTVSFHVSQDEAKSLLELAQMRDILMQVACVPIDRGIDVDLNLAMEP